MPLGRDLSLFPGVLRVSRLYVWQLLVERITPLVAGGRLEVGIVDDGVDLENGSNHGIVLRSDSTLNGGAWTVVTKRTSGGASVIGANTGQVPGGIQALELRYLDSLAPVMEFRINGVIAAAVAGLANLPVQDGGECFGISMVAGYAAHPAGQVDHLYSSRYFVRELGAMPA
jgi:hypothetical protein